MKERRKEDKTEIVVRCPFSSNDVKFYFNTKVNNSGQCYQKQSWEK